jgi:hypothetical protein
VLADLRSTVASVEDQLDRTLLLVLSIVGIVLGAAALAVALNQRKV